MDFFVCIYYALNIAHFETVFLLFVMHVCASSGSIRSQLAMTANRLFASELSHRICSEHSRWQQNARTHTPSSPFDEWISTNCVCLSARTTERNLVNEKERTKNEWRTQTQGKKIPSESCFLLPLAVQIAFHGETIYERVSTKRETVETSKRNSQLVDDLLCTSVEAEHDQTRVRRISFHTCKSRWSESRSTKHSIVCRIKTLINIFFVVLSLFLCSVLKVFRFCLFAYRKKMVKTIKIIR